MGGTSEGFRKKIIWRTEEAGPEDRDTLRLRLLSLLQDGVGDVGWRDCEELILFLYTEIKAGLNFTSDLG